MARHIKDYINELRWDFYKRRLYWRGQSASRNIPFEKMDEPIDFVVPWVNGADPKWIEERNRCALESGLFLSMEDNGEERFRDWDIFQYWFRSVEKYAPWVRNIYFLHLQNMDMMMFYIRWLQIPHIQVMHIGF